MNSYELKERLRDLEGLVGGGYIKVSNEIEEGRQRKTIFHPKKDSTEV